jgi:predicted AAA+ superfamily ATPase
MADVDPIPRRVRSSVVEALEDTRVVLISGARQTGKSTLAASIARGEHPADIVTLDDAGQRAAAQADPKGFIARRTGPVVIDEIQRVPELLLAIKMAVDLDNAPGRFLLTGSANILSAPRVMDSLAGRIEIVTLWPFSQGELADVEESFVDALFDNRPQSLKAIPVDFHGLAALLARGGFPEVVSRSAPERRRRWFESYVQSTVERDIRDLADVRRSDEIGRLLRLIATRVGNIWQPATVARDLSIGRLTVESYIGLLETLYVVRRLPAWRPGLNARVVRAPKAYVVDSGLLAHLLNADAKRIVDDVRISGMVLESFVAMEVLRQLEHSRPRVLAHHFRDKDDREVDLVLESVRGDVAGIEVKASATVRPRDFKGLQQLKRLAGDRFACGVVLYVGEQTIPFGDGLWAVPVSALWAAR